MQTENSDPLENGTIKASVHVYGGSGAVCFEADANRRHAPTLAIDGAKAVAAKTYDWRGKTRLQLSTNELAELTAVLMGMATQCEARYHGVNKNKHLTLENQGSHFFMRIQEAERLIAVPIPPADGLRAGMLAMRQLQLAVGGAESSVVLTALRNLGRMMGAKRESEQVAR